MFALAHHFRESLIVAVILFVIVIVIPITITITSIPARVEP